MLQNQQNPKGFEFCWCDFKLPSSMCFRKSRKSALAWAEQSWANLSKVYLIRPAIQLSNYVLIIFYNLFLISYLICWKRCRVITYHVHNIVGILVNHTGSIFPKNDLKVKKWLKPGNYQCPTCRLPCGRCTHLWLWKLASSPMIHHWPLKL